MTLSRERCADIPEETVDEHRSGNDLGFARPVSMNHEGQ